MDEIECIALAQQVGSPQYCRERAQLLWPCPLSQEQVALVVPFLMANLECQLGSLEWGADRCYWSVNFEGARLCLQFEALCEMLWLQSVKNEDESNQVMEFLAQQLGAHHV